jgi:hypothetical protein
MRAAYGCQESFSQQPWYFFHFLFMLSATWRPRPVLKEAKPKLSGKSWPTGFDRRSSTKLSW